MDLSSEHLRPSAFRHHCSRLGQRFETWYRQSVGNRGLEHFVERNLFRSRWLLVPLHIGLSALLLLIAIKFMADVVFLYYEVLVEDGLHLTFSRDTAGLANPPRLGQTDTADLTKLILRALELVDLMMVATLIVMVMLSTYQYFVSRIDFKGSTDKLDWVRELDSGRLKIKIGASIVAISSIQLLRTFMDVMQDDEISNPKLFWLVGMHLTFVISVVLMGLLERIEIGSHRRKRGHQKHVTAPDRLAPDGLPEDEPPRAGSAVATAGAAGQATPPE